MSEWFDEKFPDTVPLSVGVKAEDGTIVDVGPYRHRVIWTGDDQVSCVSYCNYCGSPFAVSGTLDSVEIMWCGECGVFQGFVQTKDANSGS
jgi:hypothetical protein